MFIADSDDSVYEAIERRAYRRGVVRGSIVMLASAIAALGISGAVMFAMVHVQPAQHSTHYLVCPIDSPGHANNCSVVNLPR